MSKADRTGALLVSLLVLLATASPQTRIAPVAQNNLGVALMSQGKYVEARAAFARAGHTLNQGIAALAQGRHEDAEKFFRAVLTREPNNIRGHYNLGLLYRKLGRLEDSLKAFEAAGRIDPDDLHLRYYLGAVDFSLHRYPAAIAHYRKVVDEDPTFVSALFGLGRAYVLSGDDAKGNVYLQRFSELTAGSRLNESAGQQYGEQGGYALAEETPRASAPAPPAIAVRFVATELKSVSTPACVLDAFGDGRPDVLIPGAGLFRNRSGKLDPVPGAWPGTACAAGDFNNDGRTDIAIGQGDRVVLYKSATPGKFEKVAEIPGGPGVLFLDFDHDGWLDLLAGGRILRNKGDGTFADITRASKIEAAEPLAITDFDNHRDIDLLVRTATGAATLYANKRDGSFEPVRWWPSEAAVTSAAVLDYNNDGWMDFFLTRSTGCPVLLENVGGRQFRSVSLPDCRESGTRGAATLDYDNDGFRDLVFAGKNVHVFRNLGNGRFEDVSAALGLHRITWTRPEQITPAEFDDDGAVDMLVTQSRGPAFLLRNNGGARNGSLKVKLTGVKDNKSAIGTKVEVRAGRSWQKVEHTSGFPEEVFGLGARKTADSVRMLWPTGVLQDELPGTSTRVAYTELDRKGGSCPILYVWDGQRFRFLSDMIGAGVIGEWVSPGVYNDSDPDEYLVAEGAVPKNGRYLFRFTGQMEEVTYLDAARLLVVDHPAEIKVMPNEVFANTGPFKVWKLRDARPAEVAAPALQKTAFMGFVRPHSVDLDLPQGANVLLLYGWTEYYDSTSSYLAYHTGLRPDPPKLKVPDGRGGWRVALPSIGFPAGLPKWMVVDLAGVDSRRVRISTNMEIYWQKAIAGRTDEGAPVRVTALAPAKADLRFLGYPKETTRRPEAYDYQQISRSGPYAVHRGAYTRYGEVTELMQTADDRYAILASGDEVALEFDATRLPPLPDGWKRTVIFKAEGFEKGMDFLIANPLSVTPLPLHPGQVESPALLDYRLRYNTRLR